MKKLSFQEITARRHSLKSIRTAERFPVYALLDNIRSLYNVGSIFRTADALRLKKLFLTGFTGSPPRKEIDKTALGAVETVPWEYHRDPLTIILRLKEQGVKIIILEHTSESREFNQLDYAFPCCFVAGNEVEGIRDEIVAQADTAVEIPMFGTKQSLNVTIAFGILGYEILFQYLSRNRSDSGSAANAD
ncbi:MAG: RNA methyltransferase [Calditrichia bacterium]